MKRNIETDLFENVRFPIGNRIVSKLMLELSHRDALISTALYQNVHSLHDTYTAMYSRYSLDSNIMRVVKTPLPKRRNW